MTSRDLINIAGIYEGSDGEATKALYAELQALGPIGIVAVNLFRAQKCSARAKVYRGRGYRDAAYDRKQWSMDNLVDVLLEHSSLGLTWGWKEDPRAEYHKWVLYVELPVGQVSFHTLTRGKGPDYPGDWDGRKDVSPGRICQFVAKVFREAEVVA
ncbi:MAG: hypothetical protein A3E78_07455 [Alphaproteobacteria bacterium RIFCSPHIGHO2_12_FULL_63_12]|nr:MAG: hypothetical protein A3E78_07455 [Alphaproteobacteria bacterium RIFCSPHIGHO2_12_FULL_63_12]